MSISVLESNTNHNTKIQNELDQLAREEAWKEGMEAERQVYLEHQKKLGQFVEGL